MEFQTGDVLQHNNMTGLSMQRIRDMSVAHE